MERWQALLVEDEPDIRALVRRVRRVAVLGIKPESRRARAAFYVPRYLQRSGLEVVPVPVYYPEVMEILGEPVYRSSASGTMPRPGRWPRPGSRWCRTGA